MASRLPPGEAERRAKARAAATWSGEKYKKVTPGTEEDWAAIAAAFVNGDVSFLEEARASSSASKSHPSGGYEKKRKNPNPYLAALDLDDMPIDFAGLKKGYRSAVMAAFRSAEFKDTAPAYVMAFAVITKAYDRIRLQNRW